MTIDPGSARASPAPVDPDPLHVVRATLVEHARRDVAAELAAAEAEGGRLLTTARQDADRMRDRARAEGEGDAETMRLEQRARARRRARAAILRAQSEALEMLRRDVHDRIRQLWRDERTRPLVRDRLEATARSDLGPDVSTADHPDGGVTATIDHARATYLLTDLADQVIEELGDDLVGLWTP